MCVCGGDGVVELVGLNIPQREEVFAFDARRGDLCLSQDLCGESGFVPEFDLLVEVEESHGDIFDIAAQRECDFVFLDGAIVVVEVEVVGFGDAFMNGALDFGVVGEFEQEVEDGEGFWPALHFEENFEFEIDDGSEIGSDTQSVIEAFQRDVCMLCGV